MTGNTPTPDRRSLVTDLLDWLEQREESAHHIDQVLRLLAHERRRHILAVVYAYGEALTLADVADEVAIRETGSPVVDISAEYVTRIYVSLYHDHLPRIVDAGLLQYDQERDIVAPPNTVIAVSG